MSDLWCKLWNFILNTFTSAVEGIGFALQTVGTVLLDLGAGLIDAAGDAVDGLLGGGGFTSLLVLGVLGYAAFALFTGDKEEKSSPPMLDVKPEEELPEWR